jgi:hypothetical protein
LIRLQRKSSTFSLVNNGGVGCGQRRCCAFRSTVLPATVAVEHHGFPQILDSNAHKYRCQSDHVQQQTVQKTTRGLRNLLFHCSHQHETVTLLQRASCVCIIQVAPASHSCITLETTNILTSIAVTSYRTELVHLFPTSVKVQPKLEHA